MNNAYRTIQNTLQEGSQLLNQEGIPGFRLDAELLLAFLLHKDRSYFFMYPDEVIEEEIYLAYIKLIDQRKMHKPFQYIVGTQEFMGLSFHVNPQVLIPRPDTETLVEALLSYIKNHKRRLQILDIGTGSGAISISLAYYSDALIWATDISPDALNIAKKNALAQKVSDQVTFLQGSLLDPVLDKKFDIIVSNPPYISKADMETLPSSVKDYEPSLALYGGPDGLDFYREIIKKAPDSLEPGGAVFFEIGYDQGEAVSQLFQEQEFYKNIHVLKDLAGLDRVVWAELQRE